MRLIQLRRSSRTRHLTRALIAIFVLCFTAANLMASPPSPELLERLKSSGQLQEFVESMREARAKGVFEPGPEAASFRAGLTSLKSSAPAAVDTYRVAVVLCDFSDQPYTDFNASTPSDFDQLLFSTNEYDNHYSMTEFYLDNSYDGFYLEGVIAGWYRLPQTYAYYVDGQRGFGSYPQNAQRMAEDAISVSDADIDYSQIDNDGDGWCDGVFVVHSGPGREQTGNDNDIHSHQWSMTYTMNLDGTNVRAYTTEPEEDAGGGLSTMGVYAHEYGHFIGLPDLYDTDYSSSGIGDWSLMAGGSWNNGGRNPAFMDSWCKKEVGFLTLTNVTSNMIDVEMPSSYHNPVAYRLWENGVVGQQYFLIENRQETGFDIGCPGSGISIYHIDESRGGNSDDDHRLVDVEPADGVSDNGDAGDVWHPGTVDAFDDLSDPNTRAYFGAQTKTAVWGISNADSVMYVNFDINYSRPRFGLQSYSFSDAEFGNGNGSAEAGETLIFTFTLQNLWLQADNTISSLTADNGDIFFDIPSVNVGTIAGEGGTGGNSPANPIKFTVPSDFTPCIDSFFLAITSDQGGDIVYGMQLHIGEPEILVVDDDNGGSTETYFTTQLFNRSRPFDMHDKSVSGSPTGAQLQNYKSVIWLIGPERPSILSAADITAIQDYLDNGGNLFLTGQSIAGQLDVSNQSFLNNYLKASYDSVYFSPVHFGEAGSLLGDGVNLLYHSQHGQTDQQIITPVNGSSAEFTTAGGTSAISYVGAYKLVLFSFGFEAISGSYEHLGYATPDTIFGRVMNIFNVDTTSLNPIVNAADINGEASVMNVVGATPEFAWNSSDTTGGSQLEYEVKVGTGTLCSNNDNMWSPTIFSGSDTSVIYAGLALEQGQTYVFQVRTFNGTTWSAWQQLSFRMNSAPLVGDLISPLGEALVSSETPILVVFSGADNEEDNLTYEFEVYSDDALTNLVSSATSVPGGGVSTTWTVGSALAEDSRFLWRSRCTDGYEFSAWTDSASFWVNAVNQPPDAFSLVGPADGYEMLVEGESITFDWQASSDQDPTDLVTHYTLQVAPDPSFVTYQEFTNLTDTSLTPFLTLNTDTTYYWKVKAHDIGGSETWSTETYYIVTPSTGCCVADRGNVNGDIGDAMDISDLTYLVDFMFSGGPAPICTEEANVDSSPGEAIDIADLTFVVDYLFGGGPAPGACP
ncbi:MAG: M6 family metalloprotease domain-containing protein [bacterium]|nr:M6 family metalloprotease domain-containing protein [bacterium]